MKIDMPKRTYEECIQYMKDLVNSIPKDAIEIHTTGVLKPEYFKPKFSLKYNVVIILKDKKYEKKCNDLELIFNYILRDWVGEYEVDDETWYDDVDIDTIDVDCSILQIHLKEFTNYILYKNGVWYLDEAKNNNGK